MIKTDSVSPAVRELLKGATEWRLIAMLLESPRQHMLPQLGCIARQMDDPYLKEIAELACEATEAAYLRFFGRGGILSPRGITYAGSRDAGKMLGEIGLLYEAFSYTPGNDESYDHMSVESDFISFLYVQEARAFINNDKQRAEKLRNVRNGFMNSHFRPLIYGLRRRLTGNEPVYILKTLIAVLTRLHQDRVRSVPASRPVLELMWCI